MMRMGRVGALALALTGLAPAGRAQVMDCWLLDDRGLAQARAQGQCRDVFARNRGTEVAEGRRNAAPPPPPPARTPAAAFLNGLERDFQAFVNDVDHDARALGRVLMEAGSKEQTPHR